MPENTAMIEDSVKTSTDLSLEDIFEQAVSLKREAPSAAAEYLFEHNDLMKKDIKGLINISFFTPLFLSKIYNAARKELSDQMGITFNNDPQSDIESVNEYCEQRGIIMDLRLQDLTGRMNALGQNDFLERKDLVELFFGLYKHAEQENLFGKKQEIPHPDGKLTIEINGPAQEAKSNLSTPELDNLLLSFAYEMEWLTIFQKLVNTSRIKTKSTKKINTQGMLVYDWKDCPWTTKDMGKTVMVPVRGSSIKIFNDFYKSIMGPENVASPIAIFEKKPQYKVLIYESKDQEVFLKDATVPDYDKYKSLMTHLAKQIRFENALAKHSKPKKDKIEMKVDVYLGVFQFKITVNIDRHDYKDEFLKSIVQGRQGERLRLARKKDLEINNGKRKYIPGSNESIDRLLDSASEFANDYLDMQGLNFLACLSNYDSQPSNYFTSGKLNDLDKICNGSSIYMAARLLGHPDVVDFLGNLSAEKKSEYFNKAIDEIDMPEIKDAAKFMNENPDLVRDDDYLFGMYCAKKLQDCQKNPIKRTVNKMYTSFKAHKAWISMYHVMTHQCRHKDTEMAKRYVRNTLSFLDTPEFSDMKCAYVDAIANSRHKHLLE